MMIIINVIESKIVLMPNKNFHGTQKPMSCRYDKKNWWKIYKDNFLSRINIFLEFFDFDFGFDVYSDLIHIPEMFDGCAKYG